MRRAPKNADPEDFMVKHSPDIVQPKVEKAKESTIGPRYNVAKAATASKSGNSFGMIDIEDKAHIEKCLETDKIVVVMIKAKWCRLCNSMKQPIARMVKKHGHDNAEYCLVDFNHCQEYCKGDLKISKLPTFKVFKNGEEVFHATGKATKALDEQMTLMGA